MKKTSILLGLMTAGLMASAQAPVRMSLFEEFTGENCNPCAATNPGLNVTLAANASKVIAIKWQVPIPSAPSATWSLYQTDKPEIDWRMNSTGNGGFGYGFAWTNTDTPTSGVQAAPTGVLDGQHQWTYGAASDHPYYLSASVINSAQAQPTNFSIAMTTSWSPTYTNCIVNASITAAANFTAMANLKFRLVLVERNVNFPTAPGSNGEKDFVDVVRKSYPTTMSGNLVTSMGTAITNTWTAGQTVTLQISCNIPNYIHDLSQMAFVGFVQDDVTGTAPKPVYQASRTAQPSIPNDMKFVSVNVPYACTGSFVPTMVAINNGTNAVTALTITPYIDGAAQPVVTFTNSIAGGASATITLGNYNATPGLSHTFSVNISNVSGGDINTANNYGSSSFGVPSNTVNSPVTEPFASFPPANWYVYNADAGPGWGAGTVGGFGASISSAKYNFYSNGNIGDADELNFPAVNTSGINNVGLSFDVAYAQYSTENDKLEVFMSIDCGNTWTSVYSKQGTTLSTAPATTLVFTPSAAQWRTEQISLPAANNQAKVLMKFVATSDYGNNLYVDNVNLGSVTGIKQNTEAQVSFELYPNPATTNATIKAYSANEQSGTVTIYNTLGQVVKSMNVNLNAGTNDVNVNTADLSAGVYNVVLSTSSNSQVKKLTISK
jgi:hypothetical protein